MLSGQLGYTVGLVLKENRKTELLCMQINFQTTKQVSKGETNWMQQIVIYW